MYESIVKFIADYLVFVLVPVFFYIWFYKREKALSLRIVLAVLVASFMVRIIKGYYYLPRPFVQAGVEPIARAVADSTFPSSHSTDAFAFATVVYLKHRRLGFWLLAVASLVALGRVLGLVHRPIDVLVGAALGSGIAFLVVKLDIARKL